MARVEIRFQDENIGAWFADDTEVHLEHERGMVRYVDSDKNLVHYIPLSSIAFISVEGGGESALEQRGPIFA